MGGKLIEFLNQELGQVKVIEHFHSFYRFKAQPNISIGKMFDLLEENKQALDIVQYSIKQTSIEQIFNIFAINQITAEE